MLALGIIALIILSLLLLGIAFTGIAVANSESGVTFFFSVLGMSLVPAIVFISIMLGRT